MLKGVILSDPGLCVGEEVAVPWKVAVGRFLSNVVPKLPIPPAIPARLLYDDPVHGGRRGRGGTGPCAV